MKIIVAIRSVDQHTGAGAYEYGKPQLFEFPTRKQANEFIKGIRYCYDETKVEIIITVDDVK